jgi:hypothetical protein
MTTLNPNARLTQLKWRYATKPFDPQKQISAGDWAATDKYATAAKVRFPKAEVLLEV